MRACTCRVLRSQQLDTAFHHFVGGASEVQAHGIEAASVGKEVITGHIGRFGQFAFHWGHTGNHAVAVANQFLYVANQVGLGPRQIEPMGRSGNRYRTG